MRQLLRGMGPVFGSMPNNFMKRYHYSAVINPLTNEEIAAYPEGFERAKVQSMKSGIMKDINRKILFSYSDDGDPEVGVMPRKLKNMMMFLLRLQSRLIHGIIVYTSEGFLLWLLLLKII